MRSLRVFLGRAGNCPYRGPYAACYLMKQPALIADYHNLKALAKTVNAIAHIHIETPRLTKQRFVAGRAAAVAVAGSR